MSRCVGVNGPGAVRALLQAGGATAAELERGLAELDRRLAAAGSRLEGPCPGETCTLVRMEVLGGGVGVLEQLVEHPELGQDEREAAADRLGGVRVQFALTRHYAHRWTRLAAARVGPFLVFPGRADDDPWDGQVFATIEEAMDAAGYPAPRDWAAIAKVSTYVMSDPRDGSGEQWLIYGKGAFDALGASLAAVVWPLDKTDGAGR